MFDRHDYDVTLMAQIGSVVPRRIAGAGDERAAVAPEHHRAFAPVVYRGGPHVEHETVLAHRRQLASGEQLEHRRRHRECVLVLHRTIAKIESVANPRPGLEPTRRRESAVTFRWCGVRDPFENVDGVLGDTANPSAIRF